MGLGQPLGISVDDVFTERALAVPPLSLPFWFFLNSLPGLALHSVCLIGSIHFILKNTKLPSFSAEGCICC